MRASIRRAASWALSLAAVSPALAQEPQDVARRLDRILAAYHEHGLLDGAVLVAMRGEVIYEKAFGLANRDWDVPHTTKTKLATASLGKALTAHLLLQLAQAGELDLDRPIAAWLPDLDPRLGEAITAHHLLTHSSGLGWWAEGSYQHEDYTLAELVRRAEALPLGFAPGSRTRYSNSGYNLLAALVEAVTGERFEDALRTRILEPAEMTDTGFCWIDDVVPRRATGYDRLPDGEYVPAACNKQAYAIGAGGLYSTVGDWFRWIRFLDRDLAPEWRARMFTAHLGPTGYGWDIGRYARKDGGGGRYAYGMGGTSGFASVQGRCLDDDHYLLVLSNVRQLPQDRIANDIVNTILGFDVDPPPPPADETLYKGILGKGVDAMLEPYREAVHDRNARLPGEADINRAGYTFLGHGRFDEAMALLRFNAAAHPQSANAHDSLSEAYEKAGFVELALQSAQRAVQVDPEHAASKARIERLGR